MPSKGGGFRSIHALASPPRARSPRPRILAAVGAALLLLGLLPPLTASAAIGGNPLTTAGPDLRSVAVTDVGSAQTRFCFDQPVANFGGNFADFHLVGYDEVVTAAGTSLGADADPKCVLVNFGNSGSDISQYTVGTVDASALTNSSASNPNIEGAAALSNINLGTGGIGGRTTGPDLVTAAKDATIPNDVLYTFDEKLRTTVCDFTKFGYFTSATPTVKNQAAIACNISGASPTVARVSFASTTNAVRFFVETGAVTDRGGDANANTNPNPLSSTTTATSAADLTGVNRIDDTTVDYTFDVGPVAACDGTKFFVFEEDTTPYAGTTCSVRSTSASNSVVRVSGFGTGSFSPFETPSAAVDQDGLDIGNTEGALPLATSKEESGFTDAPDLESADFDTAFNRVTYNFDENLNTTTDANYFVVNNDDVKSAGGTFVSKSANKVTMAFTASQINTAVGAGVTPSAASDWPGNNNVQASVGRGPAPSAGTLQFSSANFSVGEGAGGCPGGGAQLTVTRTGGASGSATVNFTTSNGTATAGNDYTAVSSPPPLSWADGDAAPKTICVPIIQDNANEGAETFNVTLSGATGAALGAPASATVTINDDDQNTGNLSFSASTYSVSEANGSATISVVRSGGSNGQLTVDFSTSNGSASAGSDYTATNGTLVFGPGVTTQTFTVPINNDTGVEGDETINLTLSNVQGGGGLTFPTSAVLTIIDNDTNVPGVLSLSSGNYNTAESGSATITVTRSGGSNGTVTVHYSVTGNTATAGQDFIAVSETLTFGPGEVTKTFSIPILTDGADESDETATITLSAPTGGATLGSPSTATLTILDDDQGLTVLRSGVTINYRPRSNAFTGRVFFPNGATAEQAAACRANRTIVLTRRGGFITSATSNSAGTWRIGNFRNPFGSYRATVNKAVVTVPGGGTLECSRAKSRRLFL